MAVRLAAAVAVVALIITVALLLGGDDENRGAGGAVPGTHRGSGYLGPNDARSGWVPSRPKRRSSVWAVGDAADGSEQGREVAAMVAAQRVDRLLYLGDVYESGTAREFASNYRPLYGRFDAIAAPTIGNHEWPNVATGYVPYWTAARGTPPPFRYAFTVSGWQLISLNSNLPADPAQERWLGREIRSTPRYGDCRIAFMHHPRYSGGLHGDLDALQGLVEELGGHARIVLAGHDHDMQRLDPIDGVTQYVEGAGGAELYPVNREDQRLAFFDDTHHGALRIALRPGRAVLTFFAADGTRLDRSVVPCRQA